MASTPQSVEMGKAQTPPPLISTVHNAAKLTQAPRAVRRNEAVCDCRPTSTPAWIELTTENPPANAKQRKKLSGCAEDRPGGVKAYPNMRTIATHRTPRPSHE